MCKTSSSESTGDAPGCVSPALVQSPSFSSTYQAFIDNRPPDLFNKAHDYPRENIASYPILKASIARRKYPAPFECDICKATFTRSHNLKRMYASHLLSKFTFNVQTQTTEMRTLE